MKRNNIFMWAYISFIFISIIIRTVHDFPLWYPLVLAITVSSILFSLEDMFSTFGNLYKDLYDIADNIILQINNINKYELNFLEKLKYDKAFNDSRIDIHNIIEILKPLEKSATETKAIIEDFKRDNIKNRKKQKIFEGISDIFLYNGFLLLFCVLIFSPFIYLPALLQEGITVFSFAVILLTQQMKVAISKTIKDTSANCNRVISEYKNSREGLATLINAIDKCKREEKENGDAH